MTTYSSSRRLLRDYKKPKHNQICMGLASKNPKRLGVVAHFEGTKMTVLLIAVA